MTFRLASDVDVKDSIVRGLLRRLPNLDLVRLREVGRGEAKDPDNLQWAAESQRILLTHDINTVPAFAYQRMNAGQPMPGVVVIPQDYSIGLAIEDLVTIIECCEVSECADRVIFLPI